MRAADLRAGDVLRQIHNARILTIIDVSSTHVFVYDPGNSHQVVYAWFDQNDSWQDWIDLEQWWVKL